MDINHLYRPLGGYGDMMTPFWKQAMDAKIHDVSNYSQMSLDSLQDSNRLGNAVDDVTEEVKRAAAQTLHQAARNGDVQVIRLKLTNPDVLMGIDELDDNGLSALHYAARFNHYDAVMLLVKEGKASASVCDEEDATPLHYTARKKQQDLHLDDSSELDTSLPEVKNTLGIVKFLTQYADVNAHDKYGSTPLHFAAMRGNVIAAAVLLECDKILVNAKDNMSCTALHDAATYNQVHVARLLIQSGARLLLVDKDKCTVLHQATIEGFSEMSQLLLESCDDKIRDQLIHARDNDQNQAIHYAVESKNVKLAKLLFEYGADINTPCRTRSIASTPLHLAAVSGDADMTKFLIRQGVDVDARDLKKATPLHKAAEFKNEGVTRVLLGHVQTKIDPRDQDEYTPLLWAVCYNNTDIVELLLDEEADIEATEKDEQNVFHLAAENEQTEVMKVLVKYVRGTPNKKLINDEDRYGNTPIHIAAENGNLTIAKLLMNNGASIEDKNEDEETPFLLAARHGNIKICRELLKRSGTVLNDENEYSNSALHLSSEAGHYEIVELLCQHGADKEARNARSKTPLDLAAANGNSTVVEYLLDEDVPPNPVDKDQVTPLHLAARNGHESTVDLLVSRGADVRTCDIDGNNCLDIAIESGNRKVALAIIQSDVWYKVLCNEQRYLGGMKRNTPLRKLIRQMPDVAAVAFSRCVHAGPEGTAFHDPNFYVDFHYEFLDDTYTPYSKAEREKYKRLLQNSEEVVVPEDAKPYTSDLVWTKTNHPLSIMAEHKRERLLNHPLVLAMIRHKWGVAKSFYFLFLAFYAFFLSMVTAYMVIAQPPFNETQIEACELDMVDWVPGEFEDVAKYIIIFLAIVGIVLEGFQLFGTRQLYFTNPMNFVDWFTYIAAIIIVVDSTPCGLRETWQWELGAFTVLVIWLDFLLYLRRLPGLGIYVVMITEIFYTFAQFFIIFFLFILAFAFSFFILLQNQDAFENPFFATVKTWVMMLGEFDFNDIFHPENLLDDEDWDEDAYFPAMTYTIFIIFVVVMGIIVMNLLVGLAVDDVNALREQAKVVKLRMQIALALDIELALPKSLRQSFSYNKWKERYYPNVDLDMTQKILRLGQTVTNGPLLSMNSIVRSVKDLKSDSANDMLEMEDRLQGQIYKNRNELKSLHTKIDGIQEMLIATLLRLEAPRAPRRRRSRVPGSPTREDEPTGWDPLPESQA